MAGGAAIIHIIDYVCIVQVARLVLEIDSSVFLIVCCCCRHAPSISAIGWCAMDQRKPRRYILEVFADPTCVKDIVRGLCVVSATVENDR